MATRHLWPPIICGHQSSQHAILTVPHSSSAALTFLLLIHLYDLQGAPKGWLSGQPEITEVLRDIRHSTEKTQSDIASLERKVSQLADQQAQFWDEIRAEIQGLRKDLQQTSRMLQQMSVRTVTYTTFGGGQEASTPTQRPVIPCPTPLPPRQLFDSSQPPQQQPSTPLADARREETQEPGQSLHTACEEQPTASTDGVRK